MTSVHMDHNDIAAHLDRHDLPDEDRAKALARFAADDAAAELLADAAFVLGDLEAEDGVIPIQPLESRHPHVDDVRKGTDAREIALEPPSMARGWRRPPARWLALAAVLAGVLLVPLALSRSGSRGPGDFAGLLANREDGLRDGWDDRPWGTTRGGGTVAADNARAAQLGVLHVDLQVAIAARQAEETRLLSARIVALLEDLPASATMTPVYRDISARAGQPPEDLVDLLNEGRENVALSVDADFFDLGAWAEAARIAAVRHDVAFFHARASRKMLDRAALLPSLDDASRAAVEAVRAAARPQTPDWTVLVPQTRELLAQIGR